MASAHTSVPRWPVIDPGVDLSGRAYAVLSFGSAAADVAAGWRRVLRDEGKPVWSFTGPSLTTSAVTGLRGELSAATVGWRLMLAGPESDLLAARAEAMRAGVLDAEITTLVTEATKRVVWCAHCGAETAAAVEVDACVGCSGCGRGLQVHHHVSRWHGTYLGFQSDAEEVS